MSKGSHRVYGNQPDTKRSNAKRVKRGTLNKNLSDNDIFFKETTFLNNNTLNVHNELNLQTCSNVFIPPQNIKQKRPREIVDKRSQVLYKHYFINSRKFINVNKVCELVGHYLNYGMYTIKRIRKGDMPFYIRLSFAKDIPEIVEAKVREDLLAEGYELRLQKLKQNQTVERRQKSISEDIELTVLSLNCNNISKKIEEIEQLLHKRRPSVVLLQETHRNISQRDVSLRNYTVHEQKAVGGSLGLIVATRNMLGMCVTIVHTKPHIILISVLWNDRKIYIGNIYRSTDVVKKKLFIDDINKTATKFANKNPLVLMGDCNDTPKRIGRAIEAKGGPSNISSDHSNQRNTTGKRKTYT